MLVSESHPRRTGNEPGDPLWNCQTQLTTSTLSTWISIAWSSQHQHYVHHWSARFLPVKKRVADTLWVRGCSCGCLFRTTFACTLQTDGRFDAGANTNARLPCLDAIIKCLFIYHWGCVSIVIVWVSDCVLPCTLWPHHCGGQSDTEEDARVTAGLASQWFGVSTTPGWEWKFWRQPTAWMGYQGNGFERRRRLELQSIISDDNVRRRSAIGWLWRRHMIPSNVYTSFKVSCTIMKGIHHILSPTVYTGRRLNCFF